MKNIIHMKLMNLVMKKMKNKMDLYNLIPEEYITEDDEAGDDKTEEGSC